MKPGLKKILLICLAFVCGYAVMVLAITLVQEVIFGGVSYSKSSPDVLLLAGIGTFASAIFGGLAASAIARNGRFISLILMCVLLAIETTYLISTKATGDPIWFDLLASLSLAIGIFTGGVIYKRFFRRHEVLHTSN